MKTWSMVAVLMMTTALFASSFEACEEEEIICDIPYEASYAKCDLKEENEPHLTEKEKKLIELEPYKAKGKFSVDRKRRNLQLWLGRNF